MDVVQWESSLDVVGWGVVGEKNEKKKKKIQSMISMIEKDECSMLLDENLLKMRSIEIVDKMFSLLLDSDMSNHSPMSIEMNRMMTSG